MSIAARPLLALLDHELASGEAGPLAHAGTVSHELWEKALLGPVRDFLQRPGKEFRARMVTAGWRLAGGDPARLPARLPLVVELLHAGSLIIDDIEDASASRRGRPALHVLYGTPVALNTGNWLYFWALAVLDRSVPRDVAAAIQMHAIEALMRCHEGQALDLAAQVCDLEQDHVRHAVATATALKTGTLMEFAALLGATAAGAGAELRRALGAFGHQLGVGLQMLDDLGALVARHRRDKGLEDLGSLRLTWPWAWLAERCDPGAFAAWQAQARAAAADGEACSRLLDRVAAEVADTGRERVARHLGSALRELEARLGPSPALREVEDEITRLETSYG